MSDAIAIGAFCAIGLTIAVVGYVFGCIDKGRKVAAVLCGLVLAPGVAIITWQGARAASCWSCSDGSRDEIGRANGFGILAFWLGALILVPIVVFWLGVAAARFRRAFTLGESKP